MAKPDVVNEFESWARVSARLAGMSDQQAAALLDELEIAAVWETADAAWSKALASEILDMRLERVRRYALICAEVQLGAGGPPRGAAPEDDGAATRRLLVEDVREALAELDDDDTTTVVPPPHDEPPPTLVRPPSDSDAPPTVVRPLDPARGRKPG